MKLTATQRLRKAAMQISRHNAYIPMNGVFMLGTKTVEPDARRCPTAYTDGINERYGEAFVDSLSDPELRFLMIHESKHKSGRHLLVYRHLFDKHPQAANAACDFVINGEIIAEHKDDGFATMTGPLKTGCYDPKYDGWGVVRVFNDLLKQMGGNGDGPGDGPGGEGGPQDGNGPGNGPGNGNGPGGKGDPLGEHGWDAAAEMSDEEAAELGRQIDTALRQGAIVAGRLGLDLPRDMEELLTPPIDWREEMREFITQTCAGHDYTTWKRPNRRFLGMGVYMPSGVSEKVERVLVGGDMSGSIGAREQAVVLGAAADMFETVKPSAVDMVYWDTEVRGHETYEADRIADFVNSTKPRGGGGTDVNCVPAFMREKRLTPQCAIILTDGHLYNGWSSWDCPVLWIIFDNPGATPTCGTAVHIDTNDL